MNELCEIFFDRGDFKDITGCLKPEGHNDYHVCKTADGRLVAWQDDYNCKCGCWDDEDYNEVCRIYWTIDKKNGITFT